jgi:signal transduction histidine kinase/CheY-like chemotaxis protein
MPANATQTAPEPAGARRIKILLVDDTPENLVSLEAALSGLGEQLVLANSGKEALRHLLEDDFAAILLDVRMPEMDGFETAELIRSRPRSRQTPILFLTGYRNEEHLFRGYDLGAVDFLFKPIVAEVLRSKVAVFIELSRGNAKLQEQADALRTQAAVLQKAEQKFRSLLEAAPDAMVVCREDGEIAMVNSQTEILFNCRRDKLISRNIRALVPDWEYQLRPGWDDEFETSKFGTPKVGAPTFGTPTFGTPRFDMPRVQPVKRGIELDVFPEGGDRFQAEFSFSPLHTEEGVVVSCSIRDVSQRKRTEERIRELNATLEERVLERTEALMRSNEELQQFAYVASHDLQEPLRTVSIYAQLLARRYQGQIASDADQFIKFIVEGSARMEKLIHDLLDFSRADARGTDFFTRMNCEEALDDAIVNIHSLMEESGAAITRGPLPWVTGDPVQLTRLFQNLLVNSIRYRSQEVPRIHIEAHGQKGEWLFSVRDNGIGIEPQYVEKIFGIFKCLQPRDKSSGSGMGLAICRKIVSRHEGRIWGESAGLGEGATFYFTLPGKE